MRRMPSCAQRNQARRARPLLEGLEERRLLSHVGALKASHNVASTPGVFSNGGTKFTYTTPSGGVATIQVVGLGNLAGTTVDQNRDLNLVFGATNAFSKIVGKVKGGNNQAPLASILNSSLIAAGQQNSLSGVGGNVLQAVYLKNFDLIAGGNINLTSGVNTVQLDSIGPGTQIHLRQLPPAPSTSSTTTTTTPSVVTTPSGATGAIITTPSSSSSSSTSASTLEALQSTSITNDGVTATYKTNGNGGQTLTAISGSFTAGTNLVESLPSTQPPQTIPPAPPGVILKVNTIAGKTSGPINLLTDPNIFAYDPTTGDVIRFAINLGTGNGTENPLPDPIVVANDPATVGLNLGWNGNQLVLLVSAGSTVTAYNATTGAQVGFFTTPADTYSIGSTDTLTVLGSYQNVGAQQVQAINLAASLASTTHEVVFANPPTSYSPTSESGLTLLGGLTGIPGSNTIETAVAALFNSLVPTQYQLGQQPINTVNVTTQDHQSVASYQLTAGSASAVTLNPPFTPLVSNMPDPTQPGAALGSIDQSLAWILSAPANGKTKISLSSGGNVTLTYPNQLVTLSEAYRPDLANSAVIDIQGNVQSIRGGSATGLVLNDTGNLNLVKFSSVTNSTIVGQPVSHLQIQKRSKVIVLTPSRTVGARNGVTVDSKLQQIGPISQTGD
jgi:hypothetical protein